MRQPFAIMNRRHIRCGPTDSRLRAHRVLFARSPEEQRRQDRIEAISAIRAPAPYRPKPQLLFPSTAQIRERDLIRPGPAGPVLCAFAVLLWKSRAPMLACRCRFPDTPGADPVSESAVHSEWS